jgi:UPF0755 protein
VLKRLSYLLLAALLLGAIWLGWYGSRTVAPEQLPVDFSIPSGSSLRSIARSFEAKGIIAHPAAFVLLGRVLGQASRIKAGSYLLDRPLSPYKLLDKITSGETKMSKVTVVEGWTFRQMRAELDGRSDVRHDTAGMADRAILQTIGAPESNPEGLFFPDTYYFDAGDSDLTIYRRAYDLMKKRLSAAWQSRAAGLPYETPYQALILASIVEKETGAPDERPMIASVFMNRLDIGMPLQTDPTVIYGLGDRYDGNIHKSDMETDTPYNTYTRRGLPPTPIALPSEEAIQAALHPAVSRALYFVAKGGGRHQFSNTLEEHNRAVSRYQLKGGA